MPLYVKSQSGFVGVSDKVIELHLFVRKVGKDLIEEFLNRSIRLGDSQVRLITVYDYHMIAVVERGSFPEGDMA